MAKLERTYDRISYLKYFPEHWEVTRIKNVFEEIDERSEDGTEELLSVSHYTGVTLKRDSLENEDDFLTNAKTLEGYKKVTKDDLVSNIMLAWNGSMGISPYDGITSPAYCVYRIKNGYNPDYFGFLFGTNLMKTEFRKKSTGIIDSRLRLYSDKFFSIFTVNPPLEEQNKIVAFIEAKTVVINHFISKKQKFIALLKEQKSTMTYDRIHIRGMKNNFTQRRIKSFSKILRGKFSHRPRNDERLYDGEFPFIQTGEVSQANKYINEYKQTLNEWGYSVSKEFPKGTLCMTIAANIADVAILNFNACFPDSIVGIVPNEEVDLDYLYYALKSLKSRFISEATLTTQYNLNIDRIGPVKIPIPSIDEQKKIVHKLETEMFIIDKTISQAEKEIELIKEYKEAMIAEAVMGKVNIKEAKGPQSITTKKEANWEFKEAVLISVLTDKFGSEQYPLGRKRYTKYSYLFHRHTDNKTEGYLKKAAGPYNPKTKYGGPEKIALQNKYVSEVQNGNLSGFVASDKIEDARNYFGNYWNTESLNWLEQLRYKKNDELELYATVDKAMVELAGSNKDISLQFVKQIIDEHPEWKPKLERDIFSDDNIAKAMEFLKQLFQ